MLKRPDLSQLGVAEKDALILDLFDHLDALMQTAQTMKLCIDALKGQ